jgi:hypothetical protein
MGGQHQRRGTIAVALIAIGAGGQEFAHAIDITGGHRIK